MSKDERESHNNNNNTKKRSRIPFARMYRIHRSFPHFILYANLHFHFVFVSEREREKKVLTTKIGNKINTRKKNTIRKYIYFLFVELFINSFYSFIAMDAFATDERLYPLLTGVNANNQREYI